MYSKKVVDASELQAIPWLYDIKSRRHDAGDKSVALEIRLHPHHSRKVTCLAEQFVLQAWIIV